MLMCNFSICPSTRCLYNQTIPKKFRMEQMDDFSMKSSSEKKSKSEV